MIAQLDRGFVTANKGRAAVRLASYLAFEGRPATTKGQFVNPFVLAHLRAVARRSTSRAIDRPVFIVGMGRSGTTVLGLVLGTHPAVGFLNEPKALWHVVRADEDIIGSYSETPGRLRLGAADADAGARQRAQSLYAWYLRATHSKRVVDKYPELIFRTDFVRGLFPDAHLVVVTRQPWPTIGSVGRWNTDHYDGSADWWGLRDRKWHTLWSEGVEGEATNADIADLDLSSASDPHTRAAVEWLVTMRAALALQSRPGERVQVVRYEALTEDADNAVGGLLERLGLARDPSTLGYARAVLRPAREADPIPLAEPLCRLIGATERQLREAV